ncbi:hypothetical protein DOK67_0001562 [Enterococcus sp. DIV0212c]
MNKLFQQKKYLIASILLLVMTLYCFADILFSTSNTKSIILKYLVLFLCFIFIIVCTFILNVRIHRYFLLFFLFPLLVVMSDYLNNTISLSNCVVLVLVCIICVLKILFKPITK